MNAAARAFVTNPALMFDVSVDIRGRHPHLIVGTYLAIGAANDEARRALAVGMGEFARTAGFWLIAEGVETEAELRTLRELDIHYIQGFLVGRPAKATELVASDAKRAA